MFRSQIDHHQGGTIFFLTSVTKCYFIFIDLCSSMPASDNKLSLAGMMLHKSIEQNKI